MKILFTSNSELLEVLQNHGISMVCNEDMQIIISDEDAERIDGIVKDFAPAALMDYSLEDYESQI